MAYLASSVSPSVSHSRCQAAALAEPYCVRRLMAAAGSFAYVRAASCSMAGVAS